MPAISISILITYFNEKELLTECLNSLVICPSFSLEILIYDDASLVPVDMYIPISYRPITKVHRSETNNGPGFGRTKLLKMASGQYVHFHDADDLFTTDWLPKVQKAIEESKSDIVLTGIKSVNEEGRTLSEDVMEINNLTSTIDLVTLGLSGSVLVPSTTFLRQLGLKVGGYENRNILSQSEDFHFHLKVGLEKPSIFLIKESLIIQRIRKSSHSHSAGLLTCYQSAYVALELLADKLKLDYKTELSMSYARIGHNLYVLGDKALARLAFHRSAELHKIHFKNRSNLFHVVYSLIGLEAAEQLSLLFQKLKRILVKHD